MAGDTDKAKAIELLAQGGMQYGEIAEEVGVTPTTLYRWRQDPEFSERVWERARARLKENLPDIYTALFREAKKGSYHHIKLVLDHLEFLEQLKANVESAQVTFTWQKRESNGKDKGYIDVEPE